MGNRALPGQLPDRTFPQGPRCTGRGARRRPGAAPQWDSGHGRRVGHPPPTSDDIQRSRFYQPGRRNWPCQRHLPGAHLGALQAGGALALQPFWCAANWKRPVGRSTSWPPASKHCPPLAGPDGPTLEGLPLRPGQPQRRPGPRRNLRSPQAFEETVPQDGKNAGSQLGMDTAALAAPALTPRASST